MKRYLETTEGAGSSLADPGPAEPSFPLRPSLTSPPRITQQSSASSSPEATQGTGSAAISGSIAGRYGRSDRGPRQCNCRHRTTRGVEGSAVSPDGAGVVAANLDPAGGADLLLDGTAQSVGSTALNESSMVVGGSRFYVTNAGSSVILSVNGVPAVTTATDQDTLGQLSCAANDAAIWSGTSWECRCLNDQPCYTGPAGTEDVGICRGGAFLCDSGGVLGSTCEGEILPGVEAEYCDGIDRDCNGLANEDCTYCDLLAQDCPLGNQGCSFFNGDPLCVGVANFGMPGDSCTFFNDCSPGLICDGTFLPSTICRPMCDFSNFPGTNDPNHCEPGDLCFNIGGANGAGVCVTP